MKIGQKMNPTCLLRLFRKPNEEAKAVYKICNFQAGHEKRGDYLREKKFKALANQFKKQLSEKEKILQSIQETETEIQRLKDDMSNPKITSLIRATVTMIRAVENRL